MFSSNLIGWQFTWGFLEWTKCDKEPCSSHANSRMWVTQSRSSCRLGKGKTRESIQSRGQPLCKFISNERKRLHKTRVLKSHRFGLKHQYGHRDVTNSRVWITLRFYAFTTECSHKSATTHKIERSGSSEQVVVNVLLWNGVNCHSKINELSPTIRAFFCSNGIPLSTAWQKWECSEPKFSWRFNGFLWHFEKINKRRSFSLLM